MEGSTDDLKWFGEGFDGFPKRLPEDCVEYTLFIIDSKLSSHRQILSRLEAVRKEALRLTSSLLNDYIWHRDGFKLGIESSNGMMYLHGLANYGDSIEDEWLIVYLLRELSARFPELWVKVVDTDGEFLLIEAANTLPTWLNPDIADNRVWIHRNNLRIIPLDATASSSATQTSPSSRALTIDAAYKIITSSPETLIHSPLIQDEAFYRLRNYPSQIADSLHYSPLTIPRKLAYILHHCPAYIAPAVEAFYLRDPIALKSLQKGPASLIFRPDDLVTVSVRFTRVLYAQVMSQQFSAPTIWKDILSQAELGTGPDVVSQQRRTRLEMGLKITSGFEMLVTDPKNRDKRPVREINILLNDLATDGNAVLPTDEDIAKWQDVSRQDDDKWLDINFEEFERELQGENRGRKSTKLFGAIGPDPPSGFGDAKTQADLKKIVERFEAFLNDEEAGIEGAEMDEMDCDDDEDEDDDNEDDVNENGKSNNSEDEDKDVSFNDEEFTRMMREMMGMPSDQEAETGLSRGAEKMPGKGSKIEEMGTDEEGEQGEGEEIRKVMQRMEAELKEAGALNLNPTPSKLAAFKRKKQSGPEMHTLETQDSQDDSDEEVNIDFNMVKNLLESFKSQGGMAGPGGNLLGMMGVQLPRDEGDSNSS